MLCKGHPKWDPKTPGKNVEGRALQIATKDEWPSTNSFCRALEAIEKWDDYHENKRKAKKKKMVEMWDDTIRPELWNKKKHQWFIGNEYWIFIFKIRILS